MYVKLNMLSNYHRSCNTVWSKFTGKWQLAIRWVCLRPRRFWWLCHSSRAARRTGPPSACTCSPTSCSPRPWRSQPPRGRRICPFSTKRIFLTFFYVTFCFLVMKSNTSPCFTCLFIVVHSLLEVGDVALIDLRNGLVVLGGHREPAHVCVDVHRLQQGSGRLCNCMGTFVKRNPYSNVLFLYRWGRTSCNSLTHWRSWSLTHVCCPAWCGAEMARDKLVKIGSENFKFKKLNVGYKLRTVMARKSTCAKVTKVLPACDHFFAILNRLAARS